LNLKSKKKSQIKKQMVYGKDEGPEIEKLKEENNDNRN